MRKIITSAMVSLDGVMQAPGGSEEDPSGGFEYGGWVAPLADGDSVFWEELARVFDQPFDLLLGRRTYEIFAAYWPHQEGGPNASLGRRFNACTKYVASRSDVPLSWKASVRLQDAANDVARLKREDGPALLTQGSSDLIQTLLAHDLIDELRIQQFPLLLGHGKQLFQGGARAGALSLTHSRVTPHGIVVATYLRAGEVKTGEVDALRGSPASS